MRHAWVSRVGIVTLVGGMVLSAGLVLMPDRALAAPPTKGGSSATPAQNWDQNVASTSRFTVLAAFGGAAVMDNNTGLVWEQTPDAGTRDWGAALSHCVSRNVGGSVGWRLPSVVELKSLQDPSLPTPFVPASIFTGVTSITFWSASTSSLLASDAWRVDFNLGLVNTTGKGSSFYTWCVRGPMNADAY